MRYFHYAHGRQALFRDFCAELAESLPHDFVQSRAQRIIHHPARTQPSGSERAAEAEEEERTKAAQRKAEAEREAAQKAELEEKARTERDSEKEMAAKEAETAESGKGAGLTTKVSCSAS